MLIIVGLGNPGRDYAGHRHNVGFMAADAIHRRHAFGPWRARFGAETSEGLLARRKALLIKPSTYMNNSGQAVGEAAHFFKVPPADVLAIHDELDLPAGKVRIKTGGGDGGHNGLRSLTGHLGAEYRRLRIGIGHPGRKELVNSWVLHDFAKADAAWLDPLLAAIADNAPLLADDKDPVFANRLHLAVEAATGGGKPKPAKASAPVADSKSEPEAALESGLPKSAVTARSDSAKVHSAKPTEGPLARGLRKLLGGSD